MQATKFVHAKCRNCVGSRHPRLGSITLLRHCSPCTDRLIRMWMFQPKRHVLHLKNKTYDYSPDSVSVASPGVCKSVDETAAATNTERVGQIS